MLTVFLEMGLFSVCFVSLLSLVSAPLGNISETVFRPINRFEETEFSEYCIGSPVSARTSEEKDLRVLIPDSFKKSHQCGRAVGKGS